MDATPSYLWGVVGHLADVPRMLHLVSPNALVVFLLRKPVSRIQSLYSHWTRVIDASKHRSPLYALLGLHLEDHVRYELDYLQHLLREEQNTTDDILPFVTGNVTQYAHLLERHDDRGEKFITTYKDLFHGFGDWLVASNVNCHNVTGSKNSKLTDNRHHCNVFVSFILSALSAPHLSHWLAYFSSRIVVVESEAYFQRRDVLLDLPLRTDVSHETSDHKVANKGVYQTEGPAADYSYQLSTPLKDRFTAFLIAPNRGLINLLRAGARSGALLVAPPIDDGDDNQVWAWLPHGVRTRSLNRPS